MVEMIAQYANTYFHTSMMEKMYTELFYDIVTSLFPTFCHSDIPTSHRSAKTQWSLFQQ